MDARRAPPILRHHTADELPERDRGPGASRLAGEAAPVGPIRSSVPGDDGGGLDDRQGLRPLAPQRPQGDPEEAVSRSQPWTATAVSQGRELLSQGEILEDEGVSRSGEGATRP